VGHWHIQGYGLFSIVEKKAGRWIGKTGHACFKRDLGFSAGTNIEASWIIEPNAQGTGYAMEAAMAAQRWFDDRHRGRTACLIDPENAGSTRLAIKLRYSRAGQIPRRDRAAILFVRDTASR
jgi:RimJ/RimL family protein N-acetyltransferase